MLRRIQASRVAAYVIIALAVLVTVFPFYWMIRTALTPQADLIADSTRLWPSHPTPSKIKTLRRPGGRGGVGFPHVSGGGGGGAGGVGAARPPPTGQ